MFYDYQSLLLIVVVVLVVLSTTMTFSLYYREQKGQSNFIYMYFMVVCLIGVLGTIIFGGKVIDDMIDKSFTAKSDIINSYNANYIDPYACQIQHGNFVNDNTLNNLSKEQIKECQDVQKQRVQDFAANEAQRVRTKGYFMIGFLIFITLIHAIGAFLTRKKL